MAGFLAKAQAFLRKKSETKQAYLDREHELRTKMTELEAQKSNITANYDPTKPYDAKAIDKIDEKIEVASKELALLTTNLPKISDYDLDELTSHLVEARTEAEKALNKKAQDAEKVRDDILAAKQTYLQKLADYQRIQTDAESVKYEVKEMLAELTTPVKKEIEKLRSQLIEVDYQLYEKASAGSGQGLRTDQVEIDLLEKRKGELGRRIAKLESHIGDIGSKVPDLRQYTDGNMQNIYYIHDKEQFDAAEKGITKS
ncbi:hypothetical protein [Cytobacillus horneckiae]|uniref:Uncharacterized protein n=1 Tax=Cytobacillus horneckiae TaxID=549687 RepID=A0A2N0ZEA5_9BACI|nr:hypothetical protein [Cytobacillus horneckiae]MEC1157560.1 hypothetical protein [Cytobacillus horneckiae]MED2939508.1 hypothetical protein [Cytobacillus horneckiae]PKG27838.1 hypothetical protein CWS20_17260 [Cytobacillus horneckiae]